MGRARIAWAVAAVATIVAVALGLALVRGGGGSRSPQRTLRAVVLGPPNQRLSTRPTDAALSPDGRWIVMTVADSAGNCSLWLRSLDALEVRPIPGAEVGQLEDFSLPFWSPDSKTIGYFANGKMKVIPLVGGEAQVLCSAPDPRGATWSSGDVILFAPNSQSGIYRISASGGEAVQVSKLDSTRRETAHRFPSFLPDGKRFTYSALTSADTIVTWVASLGGGERTLVVRAESGARFVPTGHMVYTRDHALVASPVSPSTLQPRGEPFVIGAAPTNLRTAGTPAISCANDGTLLFPTINPRRSRAVWYDRQGRVQGDFPIPIGNDVEYAFSPDDRTIAILRYDSATSADLWFADVATGTMTRVTNDGVPRRSPAWSPDGTRIVFNTIGGAQDFRLLDLASGRDTLVFKNENMFKLIAQWTPDGKTLIYEQRDPKTRVDLWALPLEGDRTPRALIRTPANESGGIVSPDGRWILYVSDETGRAEVYACSYPDLGQKRRVTRNGSSGALWSRDGREILLTAQTELYVVSATSGTTLEIGPPRLLFEAPRNVRAFGCTADFKRFLLALPAVQQVPDQFTLLTGWGSLAQAR